MNVTILTEAELRQCVDLDEEALVAVENAFSKLNEGNVSQPPIMRVDVPEHNGEVDVKTAYIPGLESFAVKMSSGFFDNHKLGLSSLSGMMVLLSSVTGIPEALLLDNGYLTDVRTGLAGAIAANYLAKENVETVGVIGAGAQARYQIKALQLVRNFRRLMVYNRSKERLIDYMSEMKPLLNVEIVGVERPEQVFKQSDIVVTTTPAKSPYVQTDWLHPGLHITAMGSDAEEKNELSPDVLKQADVLVCDKKSQCFRLGELHHGLEAGVISEDDSIIELGTLTSGGNSGRSNDGQITICDLTGTGVQDTAIALLAYQKANSMGAGQLIEA